MPANALEYFVQRRSAHVVRLLDENRQIAGFVQALLEHLVDHAVEKGVRYADLDLDTPHITRDNVLVARITTKR